jgi:CzcA family heavy metal efflux pump
MEARSAADHVVRRRLLALPGVAQVVPIGGDVRVARVALREESLAAYGVGFDEVVHALRTASQNASGGFVDDGQQELLVRAVGRVADLAALSSTVVAVRGGQPITVAQLGDVRFAARRKRGDAAVNGEPAVVFAVLKQPEANTLALTAAVDRALDDLRPSLPPGLQVRRDLFRQASFIRGAIANVAKALRDGAVLVAVILFVFLAHGRAALVSLAALPVSLVVALIALHLTDTTLNTMTLGGLTIAIGSLVDDAIIDVENVLRCLRDERALPAEARRPVASVVYAACVEVRQSIVYATAVIAVVFVPLFLLDGVEGRMLKPLGFAFLTALGASLLVAVTLTPALCVWMLGGSRAAVASAHAEGRVLRWLKDRYEPALQRTLRHGRAMAVALVGVAVVGLGAVSWLGRTFLPEFNEGALTLSVVTLPGTSLAMSDRLGRRVEEVLLTFPEVTSTTRRTGRAELDEHAQDVSAAEIDAVLALTPGGRSREELLAGIRAALQRVSGVVVTVGQPLSHRLDHLLSGSRAAIAIKVFGDDLVALRDVAERVQAVAAAVPGAVDVSLEQQADIPEIMVRGDPAALGRFGLTSGALAEAVEARLAGAVVGRLLEGQRPIDIVVQVDRPARQGIADVEALRIDLPADAGGPVVSVPLRALASVVRARGPNTIVRESVQRKVVVQANVAGRPLSDVVEDIRRAVAAEVVLPPDVHLVFGGQFESAEGAARTLVGASVLAVLVVFVLLVVAFRSTRNAMLTLVNLPLALTGGVLAIVVTSGSVSTPGLVGLVTLLGIATRNGILLVSHYQQRMAEGLEREAAVFRGSVERLAPVLMTASCAGLALVPLVIAGDAPGNEIQAPMGVVILGGLLSSTTLTLFVLPALFLRWGEAPRSR